MLLLSVVMVVVLLVPDAATDAAEGNAFEMNFSNLKLIQLKPLQLFFGMMRSGSGNSFVSIYEVCNLRRS